MKLLITVLLSFYMLLTEEQDAQDITETFFLFLSTRALSAQSQPSGMAASLLDGS